MMYLTMFLNTVNDVLYEACIFCSVLVEMLIMNYDVKFSLGDGGSVLSCC